MLYLNILIVRAERAQILSKCSFKISLNSFLKIPTSWAMFNIDSSVNLPSRFTNKTISINMEVIVAFEAIYLIRVALSITSDTKTISSEIGTVFALASFTTPPLRWNYSDLNANTHQKRFILTPTFKLYVFHFKKKIISLHVSYVRRLRCLERLYSFCSTCK